MSQLELERLQDLRTKLEAATGGVEDDALFAEVVRTAMDLLYISDAALAERFTMSRPSVNRWRNGKTAPHPAMRPPVYSELLKLVRAAINRETPAA